MPTAPIRSQLPNNNSRSEIARSATLVVGVLGRTRHKRTPETTAKMPTSTMPKRKTTAIRGYPAQDARARRTIRRFPAISFQNCQAKNARKVELKPGIFPGNLLGPEPLTRKIRRPSFSCTENVTLESPGRNPPFLARKEKEVSVTPYTSTGSHTKNGPTQRRAPSTIGPLIVNGNATPGASLTSCHSRSAEPGPNEGPMS